MLQLNKKNIYFIAAFILLQLWFLCAINTARILQTDKTQPIAGIAARAYLILLHMKPHYIALKIF